MSITMTAEAEATIRAKVESGRYASADEVIAAALRLLEEDEQAKLERLRALIDEGFEGPFTPLTRESWNEGLARAKQRHQARNGARLADPDVLETDASR